MNGLNNEERKKREVNEYGDNKSKKDTYEGELKNYAKVSKVPRLQNRLIEKASYLLYYADSRHGTMQRNKTKYKRIDIDVQHSRIWSHWRFGWFNVSLYNVRESGKSISKKKKKNSAQRWNEVFWLFTHNQNTSFCNLDQWLKY